MLKAGVCFCWRWRQAKWTSGITATHGLLCWDALAPWVGLIPRIAVAAWSSFLAQRVWVHTLVALSRLMHWQLELSDFPVL